MKATEGPTCVISCVFLRIDLFLQWFIEYGNLLFPETVFCVLCVLISD